MPDDEASEKVRCKKEDPQGHLPGSGTASEILHEAHQEVSEKKQVL